MSHAKCYQPKRTEQERGAYLVEVGRTDEGCPALYLPVEGTSDCSSDLAKKEVGVLLIAAVAGKMEGKGNIQIRLQSYTEIDRKETSKAYRNQGKITPERLLGSPATQKNPAVTGSGNVIRLSTRAWLRKREE